MQKRITKDLLTYLPGKLLPALASFFTVPIYTHLFSPDVFGKFVLATGVSDFLMLATMSGFCSSAVRFFTAYQRSSKLSGYFTMIYGSVLAISLAVATISAAILMVCRSLIPSDFEPLLWAAIALFVLTAWFDTLMHVLRGQEKSSWYSFLMASQSSGAVIFGLILVVIWGMDVGGLIWGQTLAFFLTIIPLVWLTTRGIAFRLDHLNRSDLSPLWTFAWPVTVGNIGYWGLRISDRYILDLFRGSYDVGLYSVGYKISSRSIDLLVGLFLLVPGPIIYRVWEERGRQATEEALTKVTRLFFLAVIPAVFGLAVTAAPLIRLLAEKAYFDGYRAVWLVACASVGFGLSELGSFGSLVANRTRLIARNQLVAAGASLILNFTLVPVFGFMGAALSAAVSFFLAAGLQAVTSARFLTWRWPLSSLWRVLTASTIMSGSVLLVQAIFPIDTTFWQLANLLLSIISGALTYGAALWALGEITPRNLLGLFSADHSQAVPAPVIGEIGSE